MDYGLHIIFISSNDRHAQRNGIHGMGESRGEAFRKHCIIHLEALCAKTLQDIIQERGLQHRELQAFFSDVVAEHGDLLYPSYERWLSRGSVLQRFCSLGSNIDGVFQRDGRTSL